jgi:hypothetical protein
MTGKGLSKHMFCFHPIVYEGSCLVCQVKFSAEKRPWPFTYINSKSACLSHILVINSTCVWVGFPLALEKAAQG